MAPQSMLLRIDSPIDLQHLKETKMGIHTSISMSEIADRLAIRELVDAYATCADTRNAEGQMALFTEDTVFVVYMDARAKEPSYTLKGRASLAPVFANLNTYQTTMHFNGQSTVECDGNLATGMNYCIAHHVIGSDKRTLMVAHIRYLDKFVKQDGKWLFAERKLMVDWSETRPMGD